MKNRNTLSLCLAGALLLEAGCSTPQKVDSPSSSSPETPVAQGGDIANVLSGDFAKKYAEIQGEDPEYKDPEYALAESLDELEINSFHPSGASVEDAIFIPGHLDLWKRQKVETRWIQLHHPKQRVIMHSILMKRKQDKWYDVVSTTDQVGGKVLNFHFDVSESFGQKTESEQ